MTFNWNEETAPEWAKDYLGEEMADMGFIAQEVQEILPDLVHERSNGHLAVRYEKLVPLLVEGIKEQQKQIESLTKRLDKLEGK